MPKLPSSRARAGLLAAALAIPAFVIAPLVAFAEPPPARSERPVSQEHDPENVSAISQSMEHVAKGIERHVAKDPTAAIDSFKKAIQLSPRNPLPHALLAEVYLAANNLGEADAAIQQALDADAKNALARSRVLHLRALIFERQKKWDDAKLAWQAYGEHAAKAGDAGVLPGPGVSRIEAIRRAAELDRSSAIVRERIAAEKADAGKSAPVKK